MIEAIAFFTTGFWILMIVDCLLNDPERRLWIWVLLFLHFLGAVIYFVVRRLPTLNLPVPLKVKRWTKRQDLWNAEAAVRTIGKAHQYVLLGNLLTEIGDDTKAAEVYQQALEKEPRNLNALWGIAFIEIQIQQFSAARNHLETLLAIDSDFKYGDASLLYGKALFELSDWETAKVHLERDLRSWNHPEAALMLATIEQQAGNLQVACDRLETMLFKVKASPQFHYRRNQHFVRQAEKMLKTLSR